MKTNNCKNMNFTSIAAAGIGIVSAVVAPYAVPAVLGAVGFTSGGVAAGSLAATIQSSVYGATVSSGSVFAIAQSIGAAGLGTAGTIASSAVGAIAGFFGYRNN